MKVKILIVGLVAAGIAAMILAREGRPLTGPPAHPWTSFPIGSWVERHETVKMGDRNTGSTAKYELLEIKPDAVKIRVTTHYEFDDAKESDTGDQVIGTKDEDTGLDGFTLRETSDQEVDGTTYSCRVYNRIKGDTTTTRWITDRIPAWPLREMRVTVVGQQQEIIDVRLMKAVSPFMIKNREIPCQMFEERHTSGGVLTQKTYLWKSQRVPGHLVRKLDGLSEGAELEMVVTGCNP